MIRTRTKFAATAVLAVLLALAACTDPAEPPAASGHVHRLSALHAEPDPENGGRFIDAGGREVMLSGVNVKALGEYWRYDPAVDPIFPFGEEDADRLEGIGWNVVRLVLTWSYVEPVPGEYDEGYLDRVEAMVRLLESRGLYSIIDLHQDAWGPSLAAGADEECPEGSFPAYGWDGAPEWATLHNGAPRCTPDHPLFGEREFSPAVMQAFLSFWQDAEGPGGVGVQTRFHAMLGRLAERFSGIDAVLGYDVMNEPNAWNGEILAMIAPGQDMEDQSDYLSGFYGRALQAIRGGERRAGHPNRLMLFEPSPDWAQWPGAVRPRFEHDGQVVYSPHIYQGGIVDQPLTEDDFRRARREAAEYGGVPILTGEWGTSPSRAADPEDDYFERHQAFQDSYRISAALWAWSTACGDPHLAHRPLVGVDPAIWGFFEVDCPSNRIVRFRDEFADVVRRPLLRAAPGRIDRVAFDRGAGRFMASGHSAAPGQMLELFLHRPVEAAAISATGLEGFTLQKDIGPGQLWQATATAADWQLEAGF